MWHVSFQTDFQNQPVANLYTVAACWIRSKRLSADADATDRGSIKDRVFSTIGSFHNAGKCCVLTRPGLFVAHYLLQSKILCPGPWQHKCESSVLRGRCGRWKNDSAQKEPLLKPIETVCSGKHAYYPLCMQCGSASHSAIGADGCGTLPRSPKAGSGPAERVLPVPKLRPDPQTAAALQSAQLEENWMYFDFCWGSKETPSPELKLHSHLAGYWLTRKLLEMKVSKSSWRNGRLQARLAASISVRFAFIHVEAKLLGYVEAKLLG